MPAQAQAKPTKATVTVVERAVESIEAFALAIFAQRTDPTERTMRDVIDARQECTTAFTDLCGGVAPALRIVR